MGHLHPQRAQNADTRHQGQIGGNTHRRASNFALECATRGGIPQSVKEERIKQNFDIWDFALSEADMQKIATADTGKSEIINHFTAQTAKWLNGYKIQD